jgi:hypothetical protein
MAAIAGLDIVWKIEIAAGDFSPILQGEPAACGVF